MAISTPTLEKVYDVNVIVDLTTRLAPVHHDLKK
jgi:hypothetical protein